MQKILRIDQQKHLDRHIPPSLPNVELEIVRGAARVRRRPVAGPVFLIGTATDCDLVLGDRSIPEVHTYVYVSADGVSIRRLGAGPELLAEGRAIESAQIYDGDRFEIGPFEFLVHIDPRSGDYRRSDQQRKSAGSVRREYLDDDQAGLAQARQLAEDIRSLLSAHVGPLRLYIEPEPSALRSSRSPIAELGRASA